MHSSYVKKIKKGIYGCGLLLASQFIYAQEDSELGLNETEVVGLIDVYQRALKHDSVYKQAEYEYRAGVQDLPIARSQYLPQVNVSAGKYTVEQDIFSPVEGVFTTGNDEFDKDSYSINLSQSLIDLNKLFLWKEAKAIVKEVTYKRALAAQNLLIRTAEVYFGVLLAQSQLELASAESKALADLSEASVKRKKLGLSDDTERLDADSRFKLSEADVVDAQFRLAQANNNLQRLTRHYNQTLKELDEKSLPIMIEDEVPLADWAVNSKKNNLDLLILSAQKKSAKQAWRAARSEGLPTVDLVATYGRDNSEGSLFGEARDVTTKEVGVVLKADLFTGGRKHYTAKKAKYRYKEIEEEYDSEKYNNYDDVVIGLMGIKSSVQRIAALQASLNAKKIFSEGQKARFRNGLATNSDMLDALQSFYRVKKEYAEARYEYLILALKFRKLVGDLSIKDLAQLDDVLAVR